MNSQKKILGYYRRLKDSSDKKYKAGDVRPYDSQTKAFFEQGLKRRELEEATQEEYAEFKENREKEARSSDVIKYISDCRLLRDGEDSYLGIPVDGHTEVRLVKSSAVRQLFIKKRFEATGDILSSEKVKDYSSLADTLCQYKGQEIKLRTRVCWNKGALWYDLTDKDWQGVYVYEGSWAITHLPPLFKRYAHQLPQCLPEKEGDIDLYFKYVSPKSDDDKLLAVVYLASCFIPDYPHPIENITGPQGSTKSTTSKLQKNLIDPSKLQALTMPKSKQELIQMLSHHWYANFDNVSRLSDEQSDVLCRASSGEGFGKRQLYSDDDDVIYSYAVCASLNGINNAITKPDLMDRSLTKNLERISREKRTTEGRIWSAFEQDKPKILGGIFNLLAKAIEIKKTTSLKHLPRMADFCEWGYAIAEAYGVGGQKFLDAYFKNIEEQHGVVLSAQPVVECLFDYFEELFPSGVAPHGGTKSFRASELLRDLEKKAGELNISTKLNEWPKAPNALSRKLNDLKINLMEVGFTINTLEKKNHNEIVIVYKQGGVNPLLPPSPLQISPTSPISPQLTLNEVIESKNVGDISEILKKGQKISPTNVDASEIFSGSKSNTSAISPPLVEAISADKCKSGDVEVSEILVDDFRVEREIPEGVQAERIFWEEVERTYSKDEEILHDDLIVLALEHGLNDEQAEGIVSEGIEKGRLKLIRHMIYSLQSGGALI